MSFSFAADRARRAHLEHPRTDRIGAAWHRVGIRAKLTWAFGITLLLIVAIGMLGLAHARINSTLAAQFRNGWFQGIVVLTDIKRTVAEHRLSIERQVHAQDLDDRHVLDERLDGVLKTAQRRDATSAASLNTALRKLDDLIDLSRVQGTAARIRFEAVYEAALLLTGALLVAAALFTIAVAAWASRNVSAPLLRISNAMRRLSAGDVSINMTDFTGSRDEIGALVEAMNGYRDSIVLGRSLSYVAERERDRLHVAVSNMPVGLCMFDAEHRLIVCNSRYAEIYQLPAELTDPGTTFGEIVDYRRRNGIDGGDDPAQYFAHCVKLEHGGVPDPIFCELNDGRIISVAYQLLENNGWVATHEDVTEKHQAETRIRHMARHDPVTDLPNRVLFKEQLEEALERVSPSEQLAVLCLDLDEFKNVNDTLGHPIGDGLLQAVAERLRELVQPTDAIARFGGDEFAIVQSGLEQPMNAAALAQVAIEAFREPFEIEGHQVVIRTSIGVAVAPTDGENAEILLRHSDMALYQAKNDGRNTYRFFEPEMDARLQARRALELEIRGALAKGEFVLYYQPVFNLRSNRVSTLEALIRWQHPVRGTILPSEFIPLAEEIGLIVPIGEWVLRQACFDGAKWPEDVRIAVNLSPVQLRDKRLIETVIGAIAASKLPPNRLELEITEGVLMSDRGATLSTLQKLRALGVRIAIDDFGSGYSSLRYLRSFPFDKIKIDRSFIDGVVTDANSLAVIRAVVLLSASLGVETTAEGVETAVQLECIRIEGCTEVQGFMCGRAQPPTEVPALFGARAVTKAA